MFERKSGDISSNSGLCCLVATCGGLDFVRDLKDLRLLLGFVLPAQCRTELPAVSPRRQLSNRDRLCYMPLPLRRAGFSPVAQR